MVEAANASPRVLDSPQPAVWMTEFGENAIEHEIRVWILDPEAGIGSVRSEILGRLLELFRENGIDMPFPQQDVRIKEWPEGVRWIERMEIPAKPDHASPQSARDASASHFDARHGPACRSS